MEQTLIMNRLPLPKYYDGIQWNTIVKPNRKSIPKYLHNDLPSLKHAYLKQKFAEINKFNCPKLQYFNSLIKNVKKDRTHFHKKSSEKKNSYDYGALKQELQYALLTSDKNSNVVNQLVSKAKNTTKYNDFKKERTLTIRDKDKANNKIKRMSTSVGKYFDNTVDLVFCNRKKQYVQKLNKPQQLWQQNIEKQVQNIQLMEFS